MPFVVAERDGRRLHRRYVPEARIRSVDPQEIAREMLSREGADKVTVYDDLFRKLFEVTPTEEPIADAT